jgi:hypothetical protein
LQKRSQGCLWPWIMQALKPDNTVVTHFNQRMKSPIRSGDDIENSSKMSSLNYVWILYWFHGSSEFGHAVPLLLSKMRVMLLLERWPSFTPRLTTSPFSPSWNIVLIIRLSCSVLGARNVSRRLGEKSSKQQILRTWRQWLP